MKVKIKGKWFKVELANGINYDFIQFYKKDLSFRYILNKKIDELTVEEFGFILKHLNL